MKFQATVGDARTRSSSRGWTALRRDARRREHIVDARKLEADFYSILYEGSRTRSPSRAPARSTRAHGAHEQIVELADASRGGRERFARGAARSIDSVMPGKVVRVLVAARRPRCARTGLVVVEAMKMENEIGAPRAGRVQSVDVTPGQTVETGARLVVLD
jgi:biotin carboxyl carrier protein